MKQSLTILPFLLLPLLSFGQSIKNIFESTKGQWNFPISNAQGIDTMGTDCLGIPTPSLNLVLKTNYPESVKAIQPGLVQAVHNVDGTFSVMVKSGDYFLVYVGLSNPKVQKGDIITKDCEIGVLTRNELEDYTYSLGLILLRRAKAININRWFNWKVDQYSD